MCGVLLSTIYFILTLIRDVRNSGHRLNVSFEEYAHAVFLHFPERLSSKELFCGGSLILARVVVTSAECLEEMDIGRRKIVAYFGSSMTENPRAIIDVLFVEVHPKYKFDTILYNIGLSFLDKPAPLGPYINKIVLPMGHRRKNRANAFVKSPMSHTTQLPALVILYHKAAKHTHDTFKVQDETLKEYKRVKRETKLTRSPRKFLKPTEDEAFAAVWAGKPNVRAQSSREEVSRYLISYRVRLLPSAVCSGLLDNASLDEDPICTSSRFTRNIAESPGSGLIVKTPVKQLIGVYSALLRTGRNGAGAGHVAVFVNIDRHRRWIKATSHRLYQRACLYGQLYCEQCNDTDVHCTVT